MRLIITIAVVTLALSCWARPADDDYAYDDESPPEPAPAPVAPKAPARHALIGSRTARGPSPLIGSRGKTTTTTPPPKPAEPEEANESEFGDEEAGEEGEEQAPVVTTEAPKKGLKGGVVRPFRSNQDLLAALKRKRQQEHSHGGSVSTHAPAATPAPEKATSKASPRSSAGSSNGRRTSFNRSSKPTAAASENVEEAEPPKKPSFGSPRRFSNRGKPANPAPVNEDPEGEEEETPRAAKSYRGGRRL